MVLMVFLLILSFNSEAKEKKWREADYVKQYCSGEIEFVLPDKTRVDCLTETHAIEFDYGKKWSEAVGQSLYYAAETGKKAGIVLIVNERTKERYLSRINRTIKAHALNIDVWIIHLK
ncbi:hypothetical protein TW74_09510 [Vibrio nigripulchritudo]|nr:hypothetical protein TW74_09510 [Vibrio nigripulchritudo]